MARPITPDEVDVKKAETFPDAVFEAFNEEIMAGISGNEVTVRQDDVVKRMVAKGLDREEIFKNGWLNIEGVYRQAGWTVTYDKPGYNESYQASFTFKKKKKS